jgi:hypothetical protein
VYRQPTNEDLRRSIALKQDKYTSDAIAVKLNLDDPRIVRRVVRAASNTEPADEPVVGAVENLEEVLDQLT